MKKICIALGLASLFAAGCKENNTPIDFEKKTLSDTTYVLPSSQIPSADVRQVLVEEFTGQSCPPCAPAHYLLESQVTSHPDVVNIIGWYKYGLSQTAPSAGTTHDFRDTVANIIDDNIFTPIPGLPIAGIDRAKFSGSVAQFSSAWPGLITSQLALTSPLNVGVQSTYDTASNTATITATVTYRSDVTAAQNLSVIVVEDGMIDIQETNDAVAHPSGFDSNFVYTNVFRRSLTSLPGGDALGTSTFKEAGRVFVKVYSYQPKTITPPIDPAHCKVIAFVSNNGTGGDYKVIQSAHCKLKP